MNKYIENLHWRYATKKFNPEKQVSKDDMETLLEAIRLSASSYGLQPYEVMVIEDPEVRAKLKPAAFGQPQITDASYLLVFAYNTNVDRQYLDKFIKNNSETRNKPVEDFQDLREMIQNSVLTFTEDVKHIWASRQVYIALGNLLSAAADLKIDVCPMEGFDSAEFDELLDLKSKDLKSVTLATVGYRSEADQLKDAKKVRKSKDELFTRI
ncbi:NAD(P)H-dependent oxidoreductase [Psychroflexus gondwanensis]|jgi:nitroreductase|uniref:Dihydropteridine reductase, putative n=1 Tax=Psychroflexus gondwanensis ACAM 44 TaxID=1189619 RepID=N1WS01_9FLAO|nr:NAD(P)H-dependent oxidoreductase [Psychroflexus gondwanensis]EMY79982.1 dihydropteridine reductase, putative [Psychroflexus gondwanensis ACAM 44]TXE18674.1 NAD(P)H-dependent oxidoreductase [Psychroflexus gondwanensis]